MLWAEGQAIIQAATADLDAHLVGPPTAGPLSVAKLDALDYWSREVVVIDRIVTFTGPTGSILIGTTLPANTLVFSCQGNLQTAISAAGGAARIGIGWNTGVDTGYNKYGQFTAFAKNTKQRRVPSGYSLTDVAESLRLTAMAATGGAKTGTIGDVGQSIRVVLLSLQLTDLPSV